MIKTQFGHLPTGEPVHAYTLRAGNLSATILDLGGIIQSLCVNDCDLVAGYDTVEEYLNHDGYCGALIGRYANRIRGGTFPLNGRIIHLNRNEHNINHLHGGFVGFDKKIWNVLSAMVQGGEGLILTLVSPDGEENYPGTARIRVTYLLTPDGLTIHYEAVSDRDTPFNMTNHAYFNCNGYDSGSICDHTLQINADAYSVVDDDLIPVQTSPVSGTPFDFRHPKKIGRDIDKENEQLRIAGGYDHNFYLIKSEPMQWQHYTLYRAAELCGKQHSITVYTNLPCIQIYTANYFGSDGKLKGGVNQCSRHAVCLETQFAPDGPNRGEAILRAGESWDYTTIFHIDESLR